MASGHGMFYKDSAKNIFFKILVSTEYQSVKEISFYSLNCCKYDKREQEIHRVSFQDLCM